MRSKSPCRRRDEGFRSTGEDDSENRVFRDLKKYYVKDGVIFKECKEDKNKNKVAGMAFCVFVLFIAVEIDSKLILYNTGKVLLFNLLS